MLWSGFFLANPFGQEGRLLKLALIGFVFSPPPTIYISVNHCCYSLNANLPCRKLALFFQIAPAGKPPDLLFSIDYCLFGHQTSVFHYLLSAIHHATYNMRYTTCDIRHTNMLHIIRIFTQKVEGISK